VLNFLQTHKTQFPFFKKFTSNHHNKQNYSRIYTLCDLPPHKYAFACATDVEAKEYNFADIWKNKAFHSPKRMRVAFGKEKWK
jgi:hypothetical protein